MIRSLMNFILNVWKKSNLATWSESMDEGCMMKSDTLKTAESRPKSERRRACLDLTYESPSFVDQVQLDDLHIKCTEIEKE